MVFRNRRFTILLAGQLLSSAGNNLLLLALFWYVLTTTGSSADLALTGLVEMLAGVAALFTGVYVDRWHKRRTMIVSDALRAGIVGLMWALLVLRALPFVPLLLLFFVLQIVGAFFDPAGSAFLPLIVAHEDLPAAAGVYQSGASLAKMVGLLGGGAVVAILGFPLAVLLDGVSFLASVATLLCMRSTEPEPARVERRFFIEWFAGLRVIGRSRAVLRISAARLLANFALAPVEIVLAAWVRGPLHGTALDFGLAMGVLLAAMTLGGVLLGLWPWRDRAILLLAWGLLVAGGSFATVGMDSLLVWTMAALALFGLASGVMKGLLSGLTLQLVPAASRGRVLGALGALSTVSQPVGIAFFGALMTRLPLADVLAAIGLIICLAGASLLLPIKDDLAALSDVSV